MNFEREKLQKLGKKHKNFFEKVEVNPYAYFIDDTPYYFVLYKTRLIGKEKGYAIISPEQHEDKNVKREVFAAQVKFVITKNNIEEVSGRRKVNLTSHEKVRNYLENVLKTESLEAGQKEVYGRAFKTLEQMFKLQEEFNNVWEKANKLANDAVNKGYFTKDELEELISYPPLFNIIQYKQLHQRYIYAEDFDFIYNNRHHIKHSHNLINGQLLKSMTTQYVKQELENLIDTLTKNIVVTSLDSYEVIHQKWVTYYEGVLEERVNEEIHHLRHPS